ncbi:hypothetical protein SAMN05444349_1514 [Bacteroides faecichinchillae]|uniref:Uncharacterized protein n=1 Tax=Bacteroides faecichinchillae TaxID=871325 RepID=A0A1M5FVH7_9BACE|nr:hypothetical protein [Bacteroides faecichinchillae]THG59869.1 glycosyltransferase family 4 protein [Bacteroides faecichinchillae]SHF95463.1 hypothetical protein SAMN05444349_1514 [Bacteroides faecichinchillae]
MRILFLGEYSGAFLEICKGLNKLDVETYRISDGDSYKHIPTDYLIKVKPFSNRYASILHYKVWNRLGISRLFLFLKIWKSLKMKLIGYDVVMLNNPRFFPFGDLINRYIVSYLVKHNKKIFMAVLGDDYYVDRWYFANDNKSLMYKMQKKDKIIFELFFGKYLTDYIVKKATAIIAPTWVYKSAYEWTGKTSKLIPFACDESRIGIPFYIKEGEPIRIFHGWQKGKEYRKGNDVFDRVIKKVVLKYGNKVEYQIVQGVPFEEYQKMYSECHIYIDQLYAHDKATSGMYGMAAGKIVFAGFEEESLQEYPHYKGEEIGIPSSMDEDILYKQFCDLIDDPRRMERISKNAIEFVMANHASKKVAQMYLDVWNSVQ